MFYSRYVNLDIIMIPEEKGNCLRGPLDTGHTPRQSKSAFYKPKIALCVCFVEGCVHRLTTEVAVWWRWLVMTAEAQVSHEHCNAV